MGFKVSSNLCQIEKLEMKFYNRVQKEQKQLEFETQNYKSSKMVSIQNIAECYVNLRRGTPN